MTDPRKLLIENKPLSDTMPPPKLTLGKLLTEKLQTKALHYTCNVHVFVKVGVQTEIALINDPILKPSKFNLNH